MSKRARNREYIGICQRPISHNCALCEFKTSSITGIRLHLKATHKKDKKKSKIEKVGISKEICTECGKVFKRIEEVIRHVKKKHR